MTQNYAQNYASEVWEKDRAHFMHPWTHFDSFKEKGSLVIDSSQGAYVSDIEGKSYLDGIGGLWCVNVGYGRQEIAEAMAEQATRMAFYNPFGDTTNVPASELAAKLAELAPGSLNHVFYSCGGSTANDTAFRLITFYHRCRGKPEKRHFIARREAYHGSTYAAMSLGAKKMDRVEWFEFITDNIHHISEPNTYRRPDGMSESDFKDALLKEFEDKILEIGADNVAAFFAEPIMGAGGVLVPPDGYMTGMRALCDKYDVLFVADEVVTGFGRVGHMFASKDMFGIEPDIITCAKGLTSGYQPLGATIFSDEIWDTISAPNPDRYFPHGFTYSGHPVACAAALKNIEIIEREDICGHVREVGAYFRDKLDNLRDLDIVGDVRGSHFMACVEFVGNKQTKELFESHVDISKRVSSEAEELGLIVRPVAHLNVLSPPLIVTKAQCDEMIDILRRSIVAATDKLKSEGLLIA